MRLLLVQEIAIDTCMANPRHVLATVQKLDDHGLGVFSVWFAIPQPAVKFKSGQFLHLTLDSFAPEGGYWPESRVFSIASAPKADTIRIVYSVKGRYTRRMSLELVEGRSVWLKYPFGDFVADTRNPGTTVLVAGGTGISPFIGLFSGEERDMHSFWLYYGVRNSKLLIFQHELERAVGNAGLNLEVSNEDSGATSSSNLVTRFGKLNIESIFSRHSTDRSTRYYLSGPPSMIETFKLYLVDKGIDPRRIHIDSWE